LSRAEPRLLLLHPLVHDFAAYDFWARPLGLLQLGGWLRRAGWQVALLDCLDPCLSWLPAGSRPRRRAGGHGKFARSPLSHPPALPRLDRRFSRYGLPPESLRLALAAQERPDAVLVSSMMTYWYTGVAETIELVRERWPAAPVLLGGVYGTLCPDHARRSCGADQVLPGPAEQVLPAVAAAIGLELPESIRQLEADAVLPAHSLLGAADSGALVTSTGCPLRCPYCGVRALHPRSRLFAPERVEAEVQLLAGELGIRDLALLDDAFLWDAERAMEILERIARLGLGLRLHAASGLSCRGLTPPVARAMVRAGFTTIRLGLETADPEQQRALGGKVTAYDLELALASLEEAGAPRAEIGVYLLAGLPGQSRHQLELSIDEVLARGARPRLCEYSPVPGSPLFDAARAASPWDLSEPLFHNPTLLPCAGPELDRSALSEIKRALEQRLPRTKLRPDSKSCLPSSRGDPQRVDLPGEHARERRSSRLRSAQGREM